MTVRYYIDQSVRTVLVAMMGILVIVVVWQVISRYVLNAPSTTTDEVARFLLIWISLLGGAYYSGKNAHISIHALFSRLNSRNRQSLAILNRILIILFAFFVLVVGGGYLVAVTFIHYQLTPTLQIPMGAVYLIGPLSGFLIIYYKIWDILLIRQYGADSAGIPFEFGSDENSSVTSHTEKENQTSEPTLSN